MKKSRNGDRRRSVVLANMIRSARGSRVVSEGDNDGVIMQRSHQTCHGTIFIERSETARGVTLVVAVSRPV
jgi:hypothetical protein